jgi:acyl dehydratase
MSTTGGSASEASLPLHALKDAVGSTLGTSSWIEIDQQRIDHFAEVTDDAQWIHVDPDRAAVGPFGGTIAHGFLTLSLLPRIIREVLHVEGVAATINYGLNRVRFPSPVPVDSRIRGVVKLIGADDIAGGVQGEVEITVEREGAAKPVCVANVLFRYYE